MLINDLDRLSLDDIQVLRSQRFYNSNPNFKAWSIPIPCGLPLVVLRGGGLYKDLSNYQVFKSYLLQRGNLPKLCVGVLSKFKVGVTPDVG